MSNTKWLPLAGLTTVSLIYGANFSIAKIPMQHEVVQPLGFIFMRVLSGFIFFWTLRLLFVREKIRKQDYKWFVLCGLTGIAINQSLFFEGLKYTNPVNGALMMTCTPIIVLILSRYLLNEKITKLKLLGIFVGFVGASILILKGFEGMTWQSVKGDVLVLLNAVSFSFFLIIARKLTPHYHPFTIMSVAFSVALVALLPIGLKPFLNTEWSQMLPVDFYSVAFVLFFTTCITYLLNTWAVGKVSPTIVSSFIYLQPLFAAIIAITLKMDSLSFRMILAGSLIFLGVFLASRKKIRKN